MNGKLKEDISYIFISDNNSESEFDEDVITNYCAFMATLDEVSESSDSSSESESEEEKEVDVNEEFQKLYDNWIILGEERLILIEEKLTLQTVNARLPDELNFELEKNDILTQELAETRKKILMLNSGTKYLNKILVSGRVGKSKFALGYNGGETSGKIQFVTSKTS